MYADLRFWSCVVHIYGHAATARRGPSVSVVRTARQHSYIYTLGSVVILVSREV